MEAFAKRFSSATDEPMAIRGPLVGLFTSMQIPPSVRQSIQKLMNEIVGTNEIDLAELEVNLDICIDVARNKVSSGDTSMPEHFMAAITLYTAQFYSGESIYSLINKRLRDADRNKIKPIAEYIWLLMHALNLCPTFKGTLVFRGVKGIAPGTYVAGQIITWYQFASCAASVEVQREFLGTEGQRTLFTIELTTGRAKEIDQYSYFAQEKEVLLPANSRFEVVAVFDCGAGLVQVQLKELRPLDPILVFFHGPSPPPHNPSVASPVSPGVVGVAVEQLTSEQVGWLFYALDLDLGDYVEAVRTRGVGGRILLHCLTREELRDETGVDLSPVRFRALRAALDQHAASPHGVPQALLDAGLARQSAAFPPPPAPPSVTPSSPPTSASPSMDPAQTPQAPSDVSTDLVPVRRLTVEQVAQLLESLELGDYVAPFRDAGVNGAILVHCATKEDLAEEGVQMTNARFRSLREAVEEYTPSGVPASLLEDAQRRAEEARAREEREIRLKAEAPKKFSTIRKALVKRCEEGDSEALGLLDEFVVHTKDACQWTLLHWAAHQGRMAVVGPLVELGSEVGARNDKGWTPLHWACRRGHQDVAFWLTHSAGADPHARSDEGFTPLYYAESEGIKHHVEAAMLTSTFKFEPK